MIEPKRIRTMLAVKLKAFAYITNRDRLLVFRHPLAPEAGIQVPAGSVRAGESSADAVMREANKETGLSGLELVCSLGERLRDMTDFGRNEVHHRQFFHVRCNGAPPESWQHHELDSSDSAADPILFEFFRVQLPDGVPALIASHDDMVPALVHALRESGVL